MRKLRRVAVTLVCAGLLTLSTAWQAAAAPAAPATAPASARQSATTTPIKHFVFLMQGDRSFDNLFGTYPGADGIPAGTCQPLAMGAKSSGCVKPYELHGQSVPLLAPSASLITRQWDNGRMDGFAAAFTRQGRTGTLPMGYYDARDLPFSWAAASQYVLFDHFFAAAPYGTRLNRSYWVAAAAPPSDKVPTSGYGNQPTIFDRLQQAGVSWKFYIQDYNPAQTYQMIKKNDQVAQTERVPLLDYTRFVQDPALRGHLADLDDYYHDLAAGTLPAVSYIASSTGAERTGRSLPTGQALLRNLVTQLQLSSAWSSSAFMWSYDGSGGWYDHVAPPKAADGAQLGLRVPALLISPYVRQGVVNHTVLDSSAALAFVERNWGVAPLTARDRTSPGLAGPEGAFDFTAAPRGAALVPNGTVAAKPALVRTSIIYWFYGGAAVFVLLLFGLASATSFRRSRAALPDSAPEADADRPKELVVASSDSGAGAVEQ
jgi:phospholipase C